VNRKSLRVATPTAELLSPIRSTFCTDDEALRCRADVIERIRGDERERLAGGWIQDTDISRVDDSGSLDHVLENIARSGDGDAIARAELRNPRKKVSRCPASPLFPGSPGSGVKGM
jgi:hypothetical protein